MIVTEMADGRRYACNDFDPDDDFDDLVFTVRRVQRFSTRLSWRAQRTPRVGTDSRT